jgi:hypothetical protein
MLLADALFVKLYERSGQIFSIGAAPCNIAGLAGAVENPLKHRETDGIDGRGRVASGHAEMVGLGDEPMMNRLAPLRPRQERWHPLPLPADPSQARLPVAVEQDHADGRRVRPASEQLQQGWSVRPRVHLPCSRHRAPDVDGKRTNSNNGHWAGQERAAMCKSVI